MMEQNQIKHFLYTNYSKYEDAQKQGVIDQALVHNTMVQHLDLIILYTQEEPDKFFIESSHLCFANDYTEHTLANYCDCIKKITCMGYLSNEIINIIALSGIVITKEMIDEIDKIIKHPDPIMATIIKDGKVVGLAFLGLPEFLVCQHGIELGMEYNKEAFKNNLVLGAFDTIILDCADFKLSEDTAQAIQPKTQRNGINGLP